MTNHFQDLLKHVRPVCPWTDVFKPERFVMTLAGNEVGCIVGGGPLLLSPVARLVVNRSSPVHCNETVSDVRREQSRKPE